MATIKNGVLAEIEPAAINLQSKGKEIIRFEANGDIFIHSKLAENDKQVVNGFREFLNSQGLL